MGIPLPRSETPEPILEWVMKFANGAQASAVLRCNDLEEVRVWAAGWPSDQVTLHGRVVVEGHWISHTEFFTIDQRRMRRRLVLARKQREGSL